MFAVSPFEVVYKIKKPIVIAHGSCKARTTVGLQPSWPTAAAVCHDILVVKCDKFRNGRIISQND
jgi:hypothetical protein